MHVLGDAGPFPQPGAVGDDALLALQLVGACPAGGGQFAALAPVAAGEPREDRAEDERAHEDQPLDHGVDVALGDLDRAGEGDGAEGEQGGAGAVGAAAEEQGEDGEGGSVGEREEGGAGGEPEGGRREEGGQRPGPAGRRRRPRRRRARRPAARPAEVRSCRAGPPTPRGRRAPPTAARSSYVSPPARRYVSGGTRHPCRSSGVRRPARRRPHRNTPRPAEPVDPWNPTRPWQDRWCHDCSHEAHAEQPGPGELPRAHRGRPPHSRHRLVRRARP